MRVRQLARADVGALPADLHDEAIALHGEEGAVEPRPVLVLVFEAAGSPAAYLVLQYDAREWAVVVRRIVVDPGRPDRALAVIVAEVAVRVARAIGVHVVYASVALDDRKGFADLEAAGFRLWGILPNAGRRQVGRSVRHAPEAALARPLVAEEDMIWPAPEGLTPRAAALLQLLFDRGDPVPPNPAPPSPSLDPAAAAALAARPGGCNAWPDLGVLSSALRLSPGVVVRQLARGDVPAVIEALAAWHPALPGSLMESLLTPAPYERWMALAGEETNVYERPGFPYVAEVDGELSVFALYSFDPARSRTLRAELAVVNPRHRGLNLSQQLTPLWRLLGHAVAADTLLGWATLAHPFVQRAVARQGLDLVGISPAAERRGVAPGAVKYVCEALYATSLLPEEQTFWPALADMPDRVAALARFIGRRRS